MTPQETARKLLEYFGPEGERWCRGGGADESGRRVDARRWWSAAKNCIGVACQRIAGDGSDGVRFSDTLSKTINTLDIVRWNDRSTWPTVKAALERVAAGGAT